MKSSADRAMTANPVACGKMSFGQIAYPVGGADRKNGTDVCVDANRVVAFNFGDKRRGRRFHSYGCRFPSDY